MKTNDKLLINLLCLVLLVSCTASFEGKMDKVDDEGRDTRINFDIPVEQTALTRFVELTGSAYDKGGIQKVQLKINQSSFVDAVGAERWKRAVELELGENILYGRVINDKGEGTRTPPFYIYSLWEESGELPEPLSHSSVLQYGADTYLMGGWVYNWDFIPAYDTFLKFQGTDNQVTVFFPALITAAYLSQSVVYNGKIFLLGGLKQSGNGHVAQNMVHVRGLDGSVTALKQFGDSAQARGGAAYALVDHKLYVFGGYDYDGNPTNTILSYNLADISLTPAGLLEPSVELGDFEGFLPGPLVFAGAVKITDGKILIFGGENGSPEDRQYKNSLLVFDPLTKQLTELTGKLLYKRAGMGVVSLDDKVYLLGGVTVEEGAENPLYLDRVEVFDTSNYTSRELRRMPFSLAFMGAVADGERIVVLGGRNDRGFLTKSEIFRYYPLSDNLNQ